MTFEGSIFAVARAALLATFFLLFAGAGQVSAQGAPQGRYEFTAFTTGTDGTSATSIYVGRGDAFSVGFGIGFLGTIPAGADTVDPMPNQLRIFGVDARVFEGMVAVGTTTPEAVVSHIAITADGRSAMLAPTANYDQNGLNLLEPANSTDLVTLTEDSTNNAVVYMYLRGMADETQRIPCNTNICVLEEMIRVVYRVSENAPIAAYTIGNVASSPTNMPGFDSYNGVPEITRQAFRVTILPRLTLGNPGSTILDIEVGQPAEVLVSADAPPTQTVNITVTAALGTAMREATVELTPGSFENVLAIFAGDNGLGVGAWTLTAAGVVENTVLGVDDENAVFVNVRPEGAASATFDGMENAVLATSSLDMEETLASVTVTDAVDDNIEVRFDTIAWRVQIGVANSLPSSSDILFSLYDNLGESAAEAPTITADAGGLLVSFSLNISASVSFDSTSSKTYVLRARLAADLSGNAEIDNSQYVITLSDISLASGTSDAEVNLAGAQRDEDRAGLTVRVTGTELRWLNEAGSALTFTSPTMPTLSTQAGAPNALLLEVTDAAGNRELDAVPGSLMALVVGERGQPVNTAGDVLEVVDSMRPGVISANWERWPERDGEEVQLGAMLGALVTATTAVVTTDAVAERFSSTQQIDNERGSIPSGIATTVTLGFQAVDCDMDNAQRPCITDIDYEDTLVLDITWDSNELPTFMLNGITEDSPAQLELMVVAGSTATTIVVTVQLASGVSSAQINYSASAPPITGTSFSQTVTPTQEMTLDLSLVAPDRVGAGASFDVEVRLDQPVPANTTVTVTVSGGSTSPPDRMVDLLAGQSTQMVSFQAPAVRGAVLLTAMGTAEVARPDMLALSVNDATTTVMVEVRLVLTLDAPPTVTVGSTFPVTVGVADGMLLPTGAMVPVFVSLNGTDIDIDEVDLTSDDPTATATVTAPVTAGLFTVAVRGSTEDEAIDEVLPASAEVTAEAVALVLVLGVPDAVTVGQDYQVTVQTDEAVPAGTTLTVTVTVSTGTAELDTVRLTADNPSGNVSVTAPDVAGTVMVTAMATTVTGALEVAVSDAQTRTVEVLEVLAEGTVVLTLAAPTTVTVGSTFPVTVGVAAGTLPAGAMVPATISFPAATGGSTEREVVLTLDDPTATATVTAPVTAGLFTVAVRGSTEDEAIDEVLPASAEVTAEAVALVLVLGVPDAVTVGQDYQVTVQTDEAVPAGTTLTVTVTVSTGTAELDTVRLTADNPSGNVSVTAPDVAGTVMVTAMATTVTGALEVAVSDAQTRTVEVLEVLAEGTVVLTLAAPTTVTVGSTFPVTVGVAAGTLPAGAMVPATISFPAATGGSTEREVVLTLDDPTATATVTAPVTAGLFTVAVRGSTEDEAIDEVLPASAEVTAEAVALVLVLGVPDAVTVGQDYQVTVQTDEAVPAGTTLTVTVTVSTGTAELDTVRLTADNPSGNVSVTAPDVAGTVMVTAMATTVTGALEVAVSDAQTRTVEVLEVLAEGTVVLTLAAPTTVTVGSTFPVTVGVAAGTLPAGAMVPATISFPAATGGSTEREVVLTLDDPTATATVTAPVTAGLFTVAVRGSTEDEAIDEVLPASAEVTAEAVALVLVLGVPDAVTVGQDYQVTVQTDEAVPAGTTLTVTVTVSTGTAELDTVRLTADNPSGNVSVTAPDVAGTVMVTAMATTVTGALEVAVSDAQTRTVEVLEVLAEGTVVLTLAAPTTVTVGSTFPVTVGVAAGTLPAGAMVPATISFPAATGGSTEREVVLTLDDPTATATVTAPVTAGLFTVAVRGSTEDEAIDEVLPASAEVTAEAVALVLVLGVPDAVTVGQDYQVTVQTDEAVPAGTTLTVTVTVSTGTAELDTVRLTADNPSGNVSVTAPDVAGTVMVTAMATTVTGALEVAVSDAQTRTVEVLEVLAEGTVVLTLAAPTTVTVGSTFPVTVGVAAGTLPAGAMVPATISFPAATGGSTEREVVLTLDDPTATATVTAPVTAGLFTVAVRGSTEDEAIDEVLPASAEVTAEAVALVLVLGVPDAVTVGQDYQVTVQTDEAVPAGTTLTVTVTVSTGTAELDTVRLTADNPSGNVSVTAPDVAGTVMVTAMATTVTGALEVAVSDAQTRTVEVLEVLAEGTVVLTLAAPTTVTVGSTFPVTVGVAAGTLPAGAMVPATISFPAATGGSTEREVVLTLDDPTATATVTAPVTAGLFTVAVRGSTEDEAIDEVLPASAEVTAEAVALVLVLGVPDAVTLGQDYQVTVQTDEAVPAGTTLTVTVTVSTGTAELDTVRLTADNPSGNVSVTAPDVAGTVMVTAMATTVTGALEVAVSDAQTRTVEVLEVLAEGTVVLTLAAPTTVTVGSTFPVTVGVAAGTLPAGAMVPATISFPAATGGSTEREVVLTLDDPTATATVTAPVTAGLFTVAVRGSTEDEAIDEVLPASAEVTAEAVALVLVLGVPDAVTVGQDYQVTVQTDEAVPAGTTLTVTVTVSTGTAELDTVRLTADNPSGNVSVTAPDVAGTVMVTAMATTVTGALEVAVSDAQTRTVEVLEVLAEGTVVLTLAAPTTVTVGSTFPVTVGVAAGTLPAGAMVPATISFPAATGGSTEREVVLTLDDPTATATVTAPVTAGLFTVAVRGSTEDEAIDEVLPASAEVTAEAVALVLVLGVPDAVTLGQDYQVTVQTDEAVPAGTTLTVTVTVSTGTAELDTVRLTADNPSGNVSVTAPDVAGTVMVTAMATTVTGALEVAVSDAQTRTVEVLEVLAEGTVVLTLAAPTTVTVGSTFPVTVGVAAGTLPAGAMVPATISFPAATGGSTEREVVLTLDDPTATATVTAPVTAGLFTVAVRGSTEDEAIDEVLPASAEVTAEAWRWCWCWASRTQ